jgi:hypothetical protein
MKKVTLFLTTAILLLSVFVVFAQNETKSNIEPTKQDWKTAKKEARKLKRVGWTVCNACLSMEEQLARAYAKQRATDGDNLNFYVTGNARAVYSGEETYGDIPTKDEAIEAAKRELAGKINSRLGVVIEQRSGKKNNELLLKTVAASKTKIIEKLTNIETLSEMYRRGNKTLKGSGVEVEIMYAYSRINALKIAKQVVLEELENDANDLMDEVDDLFDEAGKSLK